MANQAKNKTKNRVLTKIYLILLFMAGIVLAFSFQAARKNKVVFIDQMLDNNLVTALTSNGIEQQDVISQFARERAVKGAVYNEYYKKIKLSKKQNIENFEPVFKTLARNFKINLSKTRQKDGSVKYSFYDKHRIYSTVVLTK